MRLPRNRLTIVLLAGITLALIVTAEALAQATTIPIPSLIVRFGLGVTPKKLPRREMTPVGVELWGQVKTTDGAHPPALREATVDLDRNVAIDTKGMPVCNPGPAYDIRDGVDLGRLCRKAIVGWGKADFEIAFPEQTPIRESSHLTIFNRGFRRGTTTLVAIASIDVPVPATIVTTIKIKRTGRHPSGLEAVTKLPAIAGGSGSLVDFKLKLRRIFAYKGSHKSFVTARCPRGDKLEFGFPKLLFRNEAKTPGAPSQAILKGTTISPCTSKR